MRKMFLLSVLLILLSAAAVLFTKRADKEGTPKKYNVILIIIDNLRPDYLGCYGNHEKLSPNIDKFARDAFIFENVFSQAGYTLPSVMSIMTSLYPVSHGVLDVYKDKLSPRACTMAEVFESYGYKTAWFSVLDEPHLDIRAGFGRGFQDLKNLRASLDNSGDIADWIEENKNSNFFLALDARSVHDYHNFFNEDNPGSKNKFMAGIEELERRYYYRLLKAAREGKPPFNDPEIISKNKELFDGTYKEEKNVAILDLLKPEDRYKAVLIRNSLYVFFVKDFGSKYKDLCVESYDAAVRYTDKKLIGVILDKVKQQGLGNRTIIVITAGHGEAFGEHNFYGHGVVFFDENLHVPLIIKMPQAQNGKMIAALTQGIDIMPTILELCGIPVPHQAQGRSLVSLMFDENAPPVNEYVFAEGGKKKMIRSREWKFIKDYGNKGRDRLYNLLSASGEKYNVSRKNKNVVSRLELKIKGWQKSLPSYRDQEYFFPPEIDRETREKIRKTGYW
ncbi:MAG: sulfatase [Candidatus Omnitrophica bacterium]|nr:sulfatase [Candidatus Omnitrophota bacterium]